MSMFMVYLNVYRILFSLKQCQLEMEMICFILDGKVIKNSLISMILLQMQFEMMVYMFKSLQPAFQRCCLTSSFFMPLLNCCVYPRIWEISMAITLLSKMTEPIKCKNYRPVGINFVCTQ